MIVSSMLFIPRLDVGHPAMQFMQLLHRLGAAEHQRSVSVAFECRF